MDKGSGKRIRVLVVEDSLVVRELLVHLIDADPQLQVVGTAADGREAVAQAQRLRPDVITMDIHMPVMDGLEATRIIMETAPTPIVVVSATTARSEVAASFRIVEAGALTAVDKPEGVTGERVAKLLETVKLMAEVKVVRRWTRNWNSPLPAPAPMDGAAGTAAVRLVAMGASTGGPLALKTILAGLPGNFPVPVVIAQHIAPGFADGFVQWLAQSSGFPVALATHGELLQPGKAYVAPDGAHLTLEPDPGGCRVCLDHAPPEYGHRPSVSHMFRALAQRFGASVIGVLLTGMGRDGAIELKQLREQGALTIAQSKESAVVPGMPGEAIDLGGACQVLPPERIPAVLVQAVSGSRAT